MPSKKYKTIRVEIITRVHKIIGLNGRYPRVSIPQLELDKSGLKIDDKVEIKGTLGKITIKKAEEE